MDHQKQAAEVDERYRALAARFDDDDGVLTPLILSRLIDLEECGIALEMPATVEEIAASLGLDRDSVAEIVNRLVRKGVAFLNETTGTATFPGEVYQMADFALATPYFDAERPDDLLALFAAFRDSESYLGKYRESDGRDCNWRVVPRWRSIKAVPGVMPCEDVREILGQFDGRIAFARCICRLIEQHPDCRDEERITDHDGLCLKLGDTATHYVENMGVGRYVSVEEALQVLEKAEHTSAYHMIGNAREVLGGLCTCCSCCCIIRRGADVAEDLTTAIRPSRFLCEWNEDRCAHCDVCADACPFSAITREDGATLINNDLCMGCGVCVVNCKGRALRLHLTRPIDHVPTGGPQPIHDSVG